MVSGWAPKEISEEGAPRGAVDRVPSPSSGEAGGYPVIRARKRTLFPRL